MILLIIATILSFVSYFVDADVKQNLVTAFVLLAVVVFTCTLSYWQERQSLLVMEALMKTLPQHCTVIRDGKETEIDAGDLTVGDIVKLMGGDKVPCDLRVLKVSRMKVEISSLTGESEPIELTNEDAKDGTSAVDGHNIAFAGSLVLSGSAVGVVIKIGDETMLGRIAKLAGGEEKQEAQMKREVRYFVKFVAILAIVMASIVFIIGAIRRGKSKVLDTFIRGFLVVIVANVPQGLPTTVTSLLVLTAKRLALKKVVVKKLNVIETFSAVNLICTDKTGTLTMNQMSVTDLWTDRTFYSGNIAHVLPKNGMITRLALVACVCNDASIQVPEGFVTEDVPAGTSRKSLRKSMSSANLSQGIRVSVSKRPGTRKPMKSSGSPTEVALLVFAEELNCRRALIAQYDRCIDIPFSSATKIQLCIAEERGTDQLWALAKGAPEVVFAKCETLLSHAVEEKISENDRKAFDRAYERFASDGKRVLAFASAKVKKASEKELEECRFCFLGMVGIKDPPKPGVAEAIGICHKAGIKTFMVTGDHPLTATAIAKETGIFAPSPVGTSIEADIEAAVPSETKDNVIVGSQIADLQSEDWDRIVQQDAMVFARTTPEQKLTIVTECQNRGAVVAVTGDGVNDAPALKKGNVGVAMGQQGSDVARDSADMILADDNFSSLVNAIEQGRLIFDNLKKTIAYTLSHLVPEITTVIFTLVLGFPAGLSTLQILSIDLLTEMAPSISLAFEHAEADIMTRPPRNVQKSRLVNTSLLTYSYLQAGVIITVFCIISYTATFAKYGLSLGNIAFKGDDFFATDTTKEFCINAGSKCFSPDEQIRIQREAAGGWYVLLVMGQFFNIWMCKTRHVSVFKHGIFKNVVMLYGVLVEFLLLMLFIYVPGLQDVMETENVSWYGWLPFVGTVVTLWTVVEVRKYFYRRHPDNRVLKLLSF